jgi:hypothetical protein
MKRQQENKATQYWRTPIHGSPLHLEGVDRLRCAISRVTIVDHKLKDIDSEDVVDV